MKNLTLLICFCLALGACSAVKTADEKGKPLTIARKYKAGEMMNYKLKLEYFKNGKYQYSSEALAVIKVSINAAGSFYEEVKWTSLKRAGKKVKLTPENRAFSHQLSLDPSFNLHIPNFAKALPLVEPITDTLTFYADLQLAIKKAMPLKKGERLNIMHGLPNSWAGGPVKTGYDCVDFVLTLKEIGRDYAVLRAEHLPTGRTCGEVPAPWMEKDAGGFFHNWHQVRSEGDGNYTAAYGMETFDDEIKFSLKDGKILSAGQVNEIKGWHRFCLDPGLNSCGTPEKFEIKRKLSFSAD